MCGIAGFWGEPLAEVLEKMAAALIHRGPDAEGFYRDGNFHLAHRRLAIVDLSPSAAQPMLSADREIAVALNGEIYNHRELRRHLTRAGHRFISDHSDTEVIIHGYRQWGESLPKKLDGMWAFALYDRGNRRLFCSRDRFGKKPFFYARQKETFAFASELTALRRHPAFTFNISAAALQKFFAYGFIPSPHTIFSDVYQLPPAYNLTLDLRNLEYRISRYWHYEIEPENSTAYSPNDENALAEQLRECLRQAVNKRLDADVPVGVLLSGGIDSSAIAALAAEIAKTNGGIGDAKKISTFSIGFRESSYDESKFAAIVATHIGSDHHLTTVTENDALATVSPLLSRLDLPFADDSLMPTFLVCREAKKKITVALGGDGGDELFGGYEPLRYWQWAYRYRRYLPKFLHPAIAAIVERFPASNQYLGMTLKLKRFFRAASEKLSVWIPSLLAPLSQKEIAELLGDAAPLEEIYQEAIAAWESCHSAHPLDRLAQYYVDLYLPDQLLAKVDRASMYNSLEVRCPFLDRDVAEFARKLPAHLRVRNGLMGGGESKYLLKRALAGILPTEILYRRKQGFSPPTANWWRGGQLSFSLPIACGNPQFVEQKLADHCAGRADHRLYLWAQLTMENFLRQK